MSAELLRKAATEERAEWGDEWSRRHYPKASAIHLALADWLDNEARVVDDLTAGNHTTAAYFGPSFDLARLIVGEDA